MRVRSMLLAGALALAACSGQQGGTSASNGSGAAVALLGAGSTFVNPFFSRAFDAYRAVDANVSINYQSIGSGGGIEQFTAQTVDFGATDVPMNAKELAAVHGGAAAVLQIPVALGGVAIAYNVPGAPEHIVLSPTVLSQIYLGEVKDWGDPAIAALNPGAKLPDLPIVVVHRADGSGTTYIFTDYLSSVSPTWQTKVGKAKTVSWPGQTSVGMKGNEGVAGQVKNTPGAIGYVELAYALQTDMAYAAMVNRSGQSIVPSIATVKAAAASVPAVTATKFSIVNSAAKGAYPLAGYTWALLYTTNPDAAKQAALCRLFRWVETDGQEYAAAIDYVDLPSSVSSRAVAALGRCR